MSELKPMWEVDLKDLPAEMQKALRRASAVVSSGSARGLYILVVTDEGAKLVLDAADMTDRQRLADTVLTLKAMANAVEDIWRQHVAASLENSTDVPMEQVPSPEPEGT